ncbi:MAG: LptF/LptG family permease, partial [Planctomycetota bacterium]
MPWLLYRHMLGELLKVFGITAAVLVFVTAIGAAIKPLAADDLIGPLQTIKYILLATVPMLQFALPFAAGFAATLVLHRMTSDNEILAASVSGVSHGRLVAPLAALGLALLLVMVGLTQWVIPRFWALMEHHLAADVTRLFQASIAKGLPLTVGNMQVIADGIRIQEDPPDSEAEFRLHLNRLAAARLDDAGKIVADVTARQAAVDIYHRDGHTLLMLATRDAVGYDERSGQFFHTTGSNASQPIVVPGAFQDDPMFKTQGQLLHLRHHPDDDPGVRQNKARLARALRRYECGQAIDRELAERGRAELIGAGGRVIVNAARFNGRRFTPLKEGPITVRELEGSRLMREIEAVAAELRPAIDSDPQRPTFDLILDDVQIVDHDHGGATNLR